MMINSIPAKVAADEEIEKIILEKAVYESQVQEYTKKAVKLDVLCSQLSNISYEIKQTVKEMGEIYE